MEKLVVCQCKDDEASQFQDIVNGQLSRGLIFLGARQQTSHSTWNTLYFAKLKQEKNKTLI